MYYDTGTSHKLNLVYSGESTNARQTPRRCILVENGGDRSGMDMWDRVEWICPRIKMDIWKGWDGYTRGVGWICWRGGIHMWEELGWISMEQVGWICRMGGMDIWKGWDGHQTGVGWICWRGGIDMWELVGSICGTSIMDMWRVVICKRGGMDMWEESGCIHVGRINGYVGWVDSMWEEYVAWICSQEWHG